MPFKLKSIGPKLVPFFKTVAVYFVLFISTERPSVWAACIKCAPIVSLIFFVLLNGMSLGKEYAYSRKIIAGLIFSCIGDACLVWPQYFPHGMAAFGVAQVFYSHAFGFKPLNPILGIAFYASGIGFVVVLLPHLEGVLLVGLPIYTSLLLTMAWRAVARVQFFQDLWTWTKLCSCVGGILFAVSDSLIALDLFLTPIPHSQALIMSTYYAAQFGIALSIVDSIDNYRAQNKLQAEEDALEEQRDHQATGSPGLTRKRRSAIPIK